MVVVVDITKYSPSVITLSSRTYTTPTLALQGTVRQESGSGGTRDGQYGSGTSRHTAEGLLTPSTRRPRLALVISSDSGAIPSSSMSYK